MKKETYEQARRIAIDAKKVKELKDAITDYNNLWFSVGDNKVRLPSNVFADVKAFILERLDNELESLKSQFEQL